MATQGPASAPSVAAAADAASADRHPSPTRTVGDEDLNVFAENELRRAYRPGDDWDDTFDRLTPTELDRLRLLFPYMPTSLARHFARRFVILAR